MFKKLPSTLIQDVKGWCSYVTRTTLNVADIPTSPGLPIIGNILPLMVAGYTSSLHKYIDQRHKQYGRVYKERVDGTNVIFISNPDIMRSVLTKHEGKYPIHILPEPWLLYNKKYQCERGLLFMDGEEWYHYRKIINNILLRPGVEGWIDAPVKTVADNVILNWKKSCGPNGFIPDLENDLYRISIDVIMSVMLGSAYEKSCLDFKQILAEFSKKVHLIFLYTSKMYMLPASTYMKLNLPLWRGLVDAVDNTLRLGKETIEKALKLQDKGDGLLAKMIEQGLNQKEITQILTDFVIAAGDTTAFTTQWTLYLLSMNKKIVDNYRKLPIGSTEESKYMRAIIKESMRLYPVAPFITRILSSRQEINGYNLPQGTVLALSLFSSGRDPQYFSSPTIFNPERWERNGTGEMTATRHATIPFAIGARSCIGQKIANLQLNEITGKIVRNFDLHLLNEKNVEEHMQMVLKPKEAIKIKFTPTD